MNHQLDDRVIRMAWEDRTSFDEIRKCTGLNETEVINVMRVSLKAGSFRLWRKRVSGRITKHGKRFDHMRDQLRKPSTRMLLGEVGEG